MSEPLLRTIIKLFAIVAVEDGLEESERQQIEQFLQENVSDKAAPGYMQMFDDYSQSLLDASIEHENIEDLCEKVNAELTQKQKKVIILALVGIILADGQISVRENELVQQIGKAFNIQPEDIELIKQFVVGETPSELSSDNILVVVGEEENSEGVHTILREGLEGFIAIVYLAQSESLFIRYEGKTTLYMNGVPLRSGKIGVFGVGSTIKGEKIEPIYYGDIVTRFKQKGDETRITFEANNISFKFPNGKLGLRDVSIVEESGNIIGLMGASGAGKSTLLNILNGSETPSEGKVLINGMDIHADTKSVEGVIGFVPQDDLLIEDLTVYQNLYFSAKLCFADLSDKEIDDLVVKTLRNLGLLETRDLKVGSPLQKTISGGQRKRINIGLELLREPSVLFVDEPTSGLSSRDSENIMDLLKELSLKGKLVFVVIHQPSSDIFKMFDKLVILDTGGYQIYYGNPIEAVVYFKDIINMIHNEHGECHECGNVNPEQIFNIIETKVVNEYGNFTNERKVSPEQWNKHFMEKAKIPKVKTSDDQPPSSLRIPNRIKQMRVFSVRDTLSKLANNQYLIINLLEAPLLAFLLAYIVRFFNEDSSLEVGYLFSKNPNVPAYLFMSVIVALFMGLTVSAEEIIKDLKILKRESFLNLSRMSYLMSKIGILFFLSAIQTFSFVLIGNYVLGIEDMLFQHWIILFSTSCMANLLGLNISSSFNSAITIYILIPILLIPQLILSGVVVRFDKLNPNISATGKVPIVGEMMTSRWAFEAAMVAQFKDNPYEKVFYDFDREIARSDYSRIYFIPALESKLDFCINNINNEEKQEEVEEALKLLRNEILKEENKLGLNQEQIFNRIEDLELRRFNREVHGETKEFLQKLRGTYSRKNTKAKNSRDELLSEYNSTPEKKSEYDNFKSTYFNETIAELVKNQNDQQRIFEKNNHLYQKIYPIYMTPQPDHFLDFRAEFYVPVKHFMGNYYDTFWFNLVVIWAMTLFLGITLYFDVLRKFLSFSGNLFRKRR